MRKVSLEKISTEVNSVVANNGNTAIKDDPQKFLEVLNPFTSNYANFTKHDYGVDEDNIFSLKKL